MQQDLVETLRAVEALRRRLQDPATATNDDVARVLAFGTDARHEVRVAVARALAHKWLSSEAVVAGLLAAVDDDNAWVRYAAMGALIEHRHDPRVEAARKAARASKDKLLRLAERVGMDSREVGVEMFALFRKTITAEPERDPLEVALHIARDIWPEALPRAADLDRAAIEADRAAIERALLSKKELLRYSAESLYLAFDTLLAGVTCGRCGETTYLTADSVCTRPVRGGPCGQPLRVDPLLRDRYGKPLVHLLLVQARNIESLHAEDPIVSISVPSLADLLCFADDFDEAVGVVHLFWPVLRKHSGFVAGVRRKRSVAIGPHRPEDLEPIFGVIEAPAAASARPTRS